MESFSTERLVGKGGLSALRIGVSGSREKAQNADERAELRAWMRRGGSVAAVDRVTEPEARDLLSRWPGLGGLEAWIAI